MKLYKTGDIAKLCGVACRTVAKWADSGRLVNHRIPGSTHRRILKSDLLKFLKDNGMPQVMIETVESDK